VVRQDSLKKFWAHTKSSAISVRRLMGPSGCFGNGCGPMQYYRHLCFDGPIQNYRRHYLAMAVGPFRNIDTSALVGPFRIIDIMIWQLLWAHSKISTSMFRWAHSGLLTLSFGDGCGLIRIYRHCCFSGSIQVYWQQYSAMAVGPFKNIIIFVLVSPLRIIDINFWRWLWAHPG
jgi:hypothetical protein